MNSEGNRQPDGQPELPEKLKTVLQGLRAFQPDTLLKTIENERLRQVMYEIFSSLGDIPRTPEDKRPEWALKAWTETFRSIGLLSQMTTEPSDSDHFGFLIG